MTLVDVYKIPPAASLVVIALVLGASVAASLYASRREERVRKVGAAALEEPAL